MQKKAKYCEELQNYVHRLITFAPYSACLFSASLAL